MSTIAAEHYSEREPVKRSTILLGTILFLISEVFLFGSLFWVYYYLKYQTSGWPPAHPESTRAIINTIVLLVSSGTIWLALHSIQKGSKNGLAFWLIITVLLGISFLGITVWEWLHEDFLPWSHAYGSIFFTLTGFHALHVFLGVMFMIFLFIRTARNRFSERDYVPVEAGSYYWHFVDFIWLIVFTTLFIVR